MSMLGIEPTSARTVNSQVFLTVNPSLLPLRLLFQVSSNSTNYQRITSLVEGSELARLDHKPDDLLNLKMAPNLSSKCATLGVSNMTQRVQAFASKTHLDPGD